MKPCYLEVKHFPMPKYEYRCKDCTQDFIIEASIRDKRNDVTCTSCASTQVFRVFSGVGLTALPTRGAANEISAKSCETTSSDTCSAPSGGCGAGACSAPPVTNAA